MLQEALVDTRAGIALMDVMHQEALAATRAGSARMDVIMIKLA